ncbi:GATA zinc finger domain-containing protein 7 isoform X2 [Malaya genurostris]|uniref:GATA zinc finger domain-containing protein 7 isoform X2 n=1 Tax=Malaya genurostris TaxID=325434 RepID=UPI0026F381D8|nr:GATA zinc finger domain-containing protein 7 isoform X2 [Malaya genurostris]
MANNLSTTKMTNPIRGLVSKHRRRYTQDGFDLDLTYINDRIIAMGYPAEMLEGIYRNKIEDVQRMLDKNHAGHYKVYNLCSERSYNHERFPYYSVYPFKDHNPPDIELINSFCKDVDEYLQADSRNVVAVHCKAGKGRTGTMICCYLLYSRMFGTADEALHYYGQRRTRDSKGVTIPSQRRYVEYYATLLRSNESYRPVTLYICEIRLSPAVNVKEGTINVTGKSPQPLPEFKRIDDQTVAKLDYCMPLAGDVKIEFTKSLVLRKEKKCHFWVNTYFVEKSAKSDAEGNLFLTLCKTEIDDVHKDKDHKEYPNNFTVTLVLRRVPTGKYSESVSLKKCHSPTGVTNSPLIKCDMDNNRQPHPQHQLQQQLQQMLQHGQHPPSVHKPLNSDPNWSAIFKNQISYNETNHDSLPSVGFRNDQHNDHHHNQQHQRPGLISPQQNNHHSKQPILMPQQQQQQQPQQQQQQPLAFQIMHASSNQQPQYLDENLHCLEFSETSSSESSTEEEGWDSGSTTDGIRHHHHNSIATTTTHDSNIGVDRNNGHNQPVVIHQQLAGNHLHNSHDGGGMSRSSLLLPPPQPPLVVAAEALKTPVNTKSPIKKSASAVEAVVTSAAHKINSKLRRMSTNAIFSFSAYNSNNTNCKSNIKPSTSSSVSVSSNKCDIFNPLSSRPNDQQQQQQQQQPNGGGKGSNPSSPLASPTKLVGRSISNDPTAAGTTDGGLLGSSTAEEPRRDSLPIIGGLLSSFSSSSVSSSNSSSLSSSTFGMGAGNAGHGPIPIPKTNKLKSLFSVSSCYGNGFSGRDPDDDDDDHDNTENGDGTKRGGGSVVDNGGNVDDHDDNDDDGDTGHVVDVGSGGGGGGGGGVDQLRKLVGGCASNSDSGRSSTEIATEYPADNGCLKDLV